MNIYIYVLYKHANILILFQYSLWFYKMTEGIVMQFCEFKFKI